MIRHPDSTVAVGGANRSHATATTTSAAEPGDHHSHATHSRSTRTAMGWGFIVGIVNAATPAAMWWLDQSTSHALIITLIAAVYIGFAVADGRPHVIAAECAVAATFMILAAVAITVGPWLLVSLYLAHGCKDLWQHRSHFVHGTRWWPPFCMTVDVTVAGLIAIAIGAGIGFN